MTTQTLVQQQLVQAINRVLSDSGRSARDIKDDDRLGETLGLDSLDLAVLVVQMEQQLGVDPFRQQTPPVHTFGDLIRLYQQAIGETGA